MAYLKIKDEFSHLKRVILGSPVSFGGTPDIKEAYDPKSKEHITNGTFPTQEEISSEMRAFCDVLTKNGVEVLRPNPIENYNQIFSRDIGSVIEDKFLKANVISERSREIEAIADHLHNIAPENIITAPKGIRFEGGDIMPHGEFIFVGYSKEQDFNKYKVARTNEAGVNFIQSVFPDKKVVAFELSKSDTNPRENALHLDCCFQPFGLGHAIIHPEGFKVKAQLDWLIELIGKQNVLEITADQMYEMGANLFSINKDHVISDFRFTEINDFLEKNGYTVSKIKYQEIAKMEGLLRCSTLPLYRES